jgi:hypothetical protein
MDLKNQILVALGLNKEEVNLAWQSKLEDGTIVVSTAETLESGVDISVLTEDGTTIKLPQGSYILDTGVSFRVEEEGIVAEVMESETEEEDTTEEVEASEELAENVEFAFPETDAEKADWALSYEELKDKVNNLIDAVADLKRDKEGGDDDVEEMTEEVTTNPKSIKTTETVEFSVEELKAENEKLKMELAESPAEAPINTNKFSSERATPTKQDLKRMTKQEIYLYNLYK